MSLVPGRDGGEDVAGRGQDDEESTPDLTKLGSELPPTIPSSPNSRHEA